MDGAVDLTVRGGIHLEPRCAPSSMGGYPTFCFRVGGRQRVWSSSAWKCSKSSVNTSVDEAWCDSLKMTPNPSKDTFEDSNPDPATGAPGAHPVGTGVGAAAAGTAGAIVGTLAGGPAGGMIGAAVGSLIGGYAGKGVAEVIDPTVEDAYWEEHHRHQEYDDGAYSFPDYLPAYRVGYGAYPEYVQLGRTFETAEGDLKAEFEKSKGPSDLDWEKAKPASRAAWDRIHDRVNSSNVSEIAPSESEMPTSPPTSTDHVEQLAAEIASQDGHERVTDSDRKSAYQHMEKLSPQVSPDETASH